VPTALRINMTGHADDPAIESARYRAAVEMAGFAEANGFAVVSVEEHHVAENGWLPSPLTLAGAIIGRTDTIAVNCTALLITLYDPIRLAEDIAVLDLTSGGRFSFVAGLGYRPEEYAALDKDWDARGKQMDHTLETLLKAWSGEPFEYNGYSIRVTPVPVSKPHPPFAIGGMSKAAARRAARFGLPFFPPMEMPELGAYYESELERHGKQGVVFYPAEENSMLFIDEDPERAWHELAPYFLRETQEYSDWKREGVPRPGEQPVLSIDDLRNQKRYEILTPDECIARIQDNGPAFTSCLHPLCGGIPIDRAWQGLELYANKVLSALPTESAVNPG
jgi:alkanesulfonate monooxygenase SsuD/methylene tetrahydromethanopterin reductase-like flavin-dependent oxidoreductase (luciferase family)